MPCAIGNEYTTLVHGKVVVDVDQWPAIGVVDIQITIILDVEKTGSPAPTTARYARLVGNVGKYSALVTVKPVAVFRLVSLLQDARYEPVEIAVIIVVAKSRPHAIFVDQNVCIRGVAERAVLVVNKELRVIEIRNTKNIWVEVVVNACKRGCERVVPKLTRC